MQNILAEKLKATEAIVNDMSGTSFMEFIRPLTWTGGCGSMYSVNVTSPLFNGLTLVKQHRLVTEALSSEIAEMHGLTIKTQRSQ